MIHLDARLTAAQRHEASHLIISGRALRKDGRALRDINKVKGERLIRQGECRNTTGHGHLDHAERYRSVRRHAHLAAALLNGKTYKQCEARRNPQKTPEADHEAIAEDIRPYLPKVEQEYAEIIVQAWLKGGDICLNHIREKGLVKVLALEQKRRDVEAATLAVDRCASELDQTSHTLQGRVIKVKWVVTTRDVG